MVPTDDIVPLLTPLLQAWKSDRTEDESFGDFCHRLGQQALEQLIA